MIFMENYNLILMMDLAYHNLESQTKLDFFMNARFAINLGSWMESWMDASAE
jgi:hypothetical protein